jgi:hypothetical protein
MTEHVTEGFLVLSHPSFPSGCYCEHNDPAWAETVPRTAATHRLCGHWDGGSNRQTWPRQSWINSTALFSCQRSVLQVSGPWGLDRSNRFIGSSGHRVIGLMYIRHLAIQVTSDTSYISRVAELKAEVNTLLSQCCQSDSTCYSGSNKSS